MIYAGALALTYALVSLLWAPGGQPWALAELLSLVCAFALGRLINPLLVWGWVVVVASVAILLYIGAPIINPDYIACGIAIALIVAAANEWWLFLPLGLFGLVFTGARTALVAVGVGSLYLFGRRFPATAICVALFSILGAIEIKTGGASSLFQRVGIWQDTLNHVSWHGHGFGSFAAAYQSWSVHTNVTFFLPNHAYNDGLELISDLGIGTIPFWFFIASCLTSGTDFRSRAVFLTFVVLGLAYYPLWIPPCAQIAFFALGNLSLGLKPKPVGFYGASQCV